MVSHLLLDYCHYPQDENKTNAPSIDTEMLSVEKIGRMARQGQGMLLVVVAVQVGNLEVGLENGRFEGHGNGNLEKTAIIPRRPPFAESC